MIKLNQGILIALEGIDGSGKSTLAQSLYDKLKIEYSALLTRQPGATELGNKIRSLVHNRSSAYNPKAEFLLFAADRAQHAFEIINPALQEKKIIISDRFSDSSLAYQGYGRGLDIDLISTINSWTLENIKPDITIYINLDYKTCLERIKSRNIEQTFFEIEPGEYFKKIIDGFEAIYKNRENLLILDGKLSQKELLEQALFYIYNFLE